MATLEREPNSTGHYNVNSVSISRKRESNNCFCCKKVRALTFSNIGLFVLVIGYTYFGALIFRHFESPHEDSVAKQVISMRNLTIVRLWNITDKFNVIYKKNWTLMVTDEILNFQLQLMQAVKDGYDGRDVIVDQPRHWSMSSAFLYSLTVITTIGYGNISPKTNEGKIATVIYAVFGIPLMVFFLANSGYCLANCVRNMYAKSSGHSVTECQQANSAAQATPSFHTHRGQNHVHDHYHVHHIALNNLGQNQQPNSVYHCNANEQYCIDGAYQKYIVPNQYLNLKPATAVVEMDGKVTSNDVLMNEHGCTATLMRDASIHGLPHETFVHSDHCNHHRDHILRNVCCTQSIQNCAPLNESQFNQNQRNTQKDIVAPVIISLLLISGYVCLGAMLLHHFEHRTLLDGAYLCFLALSTIGFGGLTSESSMVLSRTVNFDRKLLIFGCYVLSGMVLVAMCCNLLLNNMATRVRNFNRNFAAKDEDAFEEEETAATLQQSSHLAEHSDDFEA